MSASPFDFRSAWQVRGLPGGHQEEYRVAEEAQQRRGQRW